MMLLGRSALTKRYLCHLLSSAVEWKNDMEYMVDLYSVLEARHLNNPTLRPIGRAVWGDGHGAVTAC